MRIRSALISVLGCTAILFLASAQSEACWCSNHVKGNRVLDWVTYYNTRGPGTIIFEGSVEKQELQNGTLGAPVALSMTISGQHRLVTMHVLRVYRGQLSAQASVKTGFSGADCGFDFETGKQYLVYAKQAGPHALYTDICFGTSSLDDAYAGPALRFLRGQPPVPEDLLDRATYFRQVVSHQLGTVCGRVTTASGRPLRGVSVQMAQVRSDPFPPNTADDPNTSRADGSFCVEGVSPGKYVLTGETTDFDHNFRLMGYYPGVAQRDAASVFDIVPGTKLDHLNFVLRKQPLYTVSFSIVASDGSPLPLENLGVAIDSPDRDDLSYHLNQHLDAPENPDHDNLTFPLNQHRGDGEYTVGLVPPGRYTVRTILWDEPSPSVAAELAKWRMAKQQVEINSDAHIVLKLEPAN